ncbi:MAG: EAL domain-containing protein [Burkholderiales bacterium]|nr:EAL domain-containing protein [Burkholderiales bacterium]
MFSDLIYQSRLHTRIVTAYLVLLVLGQGLTFWLIQRGIEHNVRASVEHDLITAERWLQRQLPASSVDPDTAADPTTAAPQPPTTADVRLRGVLRDTRDLIGPDVIVLTRRADEAWRLHSSTLEPPVARQVALSWPDDTGGAPVNLGTGEHLGRQLTLSVPGDPVAVRAIVLESLDEARAPYQHMKHTLLVLSALGIAAFGLVGLLTARRLTGPLRRLSSSAQRLGQGDYGTEVPSDYHGEIGEIAQSFETMRQAIRDREGQILRLASRDTLTDLPNRERFRLELRHVLEHRSAPSRPSAVLMLDMDRFKHVNDLLGQRFGDRLLRAVADRLRVHVRSHPNAMLARLGGDEFGILLPGLDAEATRPLAQRILADFERPIQMDGHTVDLSAGIGIASHPEHASDVDALLSRAEVAMFAAKQQQSGAMVYQPGLDANSQASLTLLGELRQAVDQGQLRLFLQPKVNLKSGAVVGAEALVRWDHPVRGVVPPHGFVPFAEQTGFVRLLTGWMLEEVTRTARTLVDQGLALKLSVNLSTRDLMDQELPERFAALIAQHGVAPDQLVLEITESAIMDDPQRAVLTLNRLHDMGLRLSVDDFGTGYSSLAYLKSLPVDELKIDRSFVKSMESDEQDAKIVSSTVELAHSLGLSVVAEGVENAATWHHLAHLGCDEAQGHLIARPMPAAQFADWVRQWTPPTA